MRRIELIKWLDRWLGSFLARHLPLPRPATLAGPRKFLFIRPGGAGDAALLGPAILAMRQCCPDAIIDVLGERRNAGVFELLPQVAHIFCYDRPTDWHMLVRNRYDAVIDTEQWHRLSAVVARLVHAPVKIGFATNERARLFTQPVPYCQDDYEVASFLRLLEPLGVATSGVADINWLQIPEAVRLSVVELLPPPDSRLTVAIFPGASIAEKRWGGSRFRTVAEWCLNCGLGVVLVGGEGDRADAEQIASGLDIVNLAGRTTLAQTAAIIENSAVLVSGDSGVLHIAAGLGRPTVALFGPGSEGKWAPRGPQHVVLDKSLPCSPCSLFGYTPPCSYGIRCLREIPVADVTQGISRLLALSDPKAMP